VLAHQLIATDINHQAHTAARMTTSHDAATDKELGMGMLFRAYGPLAAHGAAGRFFARLRRSAWMAMRSGVPTGAPHSQRRGPGMFGLLVGNGQRLPD
jgi:hypothetical protein